MTRQIIALRCMALFPERDGQGYLWDDVTLAIPATRPNRRLLSMYAMPTENGWLAAGNDAQLWLQLPGVARA